MSSRHRFAFSTGQKAILILGILLCLWQYIQIPSVFDAVLSFFAAGVVPGTNIVLEPNLVLRLVVASLVSLVAVVCYMQFGRRRYPQQVQQLEQTSKRKFVTISGARLWGFILVLRGKSATHRRASSLKNRYERFMVRADIAAQRLVGTVSWLAHKLIALFGLLLKGIGAVYQLIVSGIIWIMAVEGALAIWLWRWLEPQLRQLDAWLGRKVNANPFGEVLVEAARSCTQVFASLRRRVSMVVRLKFK